MQNEHRRFVNPSSGKGSQIDSFTQGLLTPSWKIRYAAAQLDFGIEKFVQLLATSLKRKYEQVESDCFRYANHIADAGGLYH